jgi:hypothetical protein
MSKVLVVGHGCSPGLSHALIAAMSVVPTIALNEEPSLPLPPQRPFEPNLDIFACCGTWVRDGDTFTYFGRCERENQSRKQRLRASRLFKRRMKKILKKSLVSDKESSNLPP